MKNILSGLLSLCMLILSTQVLADISVEVNPTSITRDESFRLTLTMDNGNLDGVPQLMVLQSSFDILGTEHRMSYSIIQGQAHALSQWSIILHPKKIGVLTIPSIPLGQQKSPTAQITVTDPSRAQTSGPQKTSLYMESQVNTTTPFVKQQVIYTVRLFNRERLLNADYQPPHAEDALMIPLGEAQHHETQINGELYAIEEQKYAFFPQKSGPLKIEPPVFHGLVYDFVPRHVHVHAKNITLQVKKVPAPYTLSSWIPAQHVTLEEHYTHQVANWHAGDTIVRTIILEAEGLPAELLPIIHVKTQPSYRAYHDKPILHNRLQQDSFIGQSQLKITYLLHQTGRITLPAIEIAWFDTHTQQIKHAKLPARILMIQPKENVSHTQKKHTPHTKGATPPLVRTADNTILWCVIFLLLSIWIITLLLWYRSRHRPVRQNTRRQSLKNIHNACKKNDPQATYCALLAWAHILWPQKSIAHVHDIIHEIHDNELEKQLRLLSEKLYGARQDTTWSGEDLWKKIQKFKLKKSKKHKKKQNLPQID